MRCKRIVVSTDNRDNCYIITAYEPTIKLWSKDYKTKK